MKAKKVLLFLFVMLVVSIFTIIIFNGNVLAQADTKKAKAPSFTIQLKAKDGKDFYLADDKGMSLYFFKKDSPDKSACAGECLTKWPVFYVEKIIVPKKLKKEEFGMITRDDGKKQSTYKGWPLYYFFKDQKPGDMNGEGFNNIWNAIYPAKFKPEQK